MLPRLIAIACLLCLPAALQAGVIYQWVDDAGRTQMSDVVPAKYQDRAKEVGASSATATPMQSREDAQKAKERIRGANAAAASSRPQSNGGYPSSHSDTPSSGADTSDCAALWRAYRESQSCFARYRNPAHNSLDPAAFSYCKEASDPSSRCGASSGY